MVKYVIAIIIAIILILLLVKFYPKLEPKNEYYGSKTDRFALTFILILILLGAILVYSIYRIIKFNFL